MRRCVENRGTNVDCTVEYVVCPRSEGRNTLVSGMSLVILSLSKLMTNFLSNHTYTNCSPAFTICVLRLG
jgi:hypothetical protein